MSHRGPALIGLWLLLAMAALPAWADPPPRPIASQQQRQRPKFIRIQRNEQDRPVAMQTAIVSYTSPDAGRKGLVVDLIGAVHVADKSYYDQLNKLFESYDALLYELVAPEGTRIPLGGKREGPSHPVGALQEGMKTMLELDYQLECIDYTKKNFVHADMSPEEFARTMRERGESFLQIFFRMIGQAMAQQAKTSGRSTDAELLLALFSKDRAWKLKRILAEQFEDIGGAMAAIEGSDGSTLISERNKKAMTVLSREIEAGKKRIGIFYGAGHLPDMEQRLLEQFGLNRDKQRWLAAWKLTRPVDKTSTVGQAGSGTQAD